MSQIEQYREHLNKELATFEADVQLMGSDLWARMKVIFQLRRELMLQVVMRDEGEDTARTQRNKGRFAEADYYFALADMNKGGAIDTMKRLQELDIAEMQGQLEEGDIE